MLIDDITIKIFGGDGGKGIVAFNKNVMTLGPTGGNGGKGGNVCVKGVSDLDALNQFRFKKEIKAENGQDGRSQFRDGHNGKDVIINLPIGTVIHNLTKKRKQEILFLNEIIVIAKGGQGGKGNFLFRSSKNTSPMQFEEGTKGEKFEARLELKFIADIGLIGLPNSGKTSLLNKLTNAKGKVANYKFTTLEPSLGVYYELILADIPGIIEGAAEGKGLGIKFLRHIERTKTLFHLISSESESVIDDYFVIRNELKKHNSLLLEKKEYVFLSKSDLVNKKEIKNKINLLKEKKITAIPFSIYDENSLKTIKNILNKIQEQK